MKIVVLISGSGRTLKNFIELQEAGQLPVEIELVVSSSSKAGGLQHAKEAGLPTLVIERNQYESDQDYGQAIFSACREVQAELVVMAGFLKLAPVSEDFLGKVINIHPSLLPAFGGQGMYGDRVHAAVIERGCKVSGATIHFVDNEYDQGPIIWQQPTPVFDDDTHDTLAARVFELEKEAYPHVLRLFAAGRVKLEERQVRIVSARSKK